MAKFNDFNFGDDGGGPDTDPTPGDPLIDDSSDDSSLQTSDPTDTLPTDATNYTEPGEGDSFRGEDPSVWSGNGNPDEPQAEQDLATVPVETQELSATAPGDPSYGRKDDPDVVEQLGDEAYGDDEIDDTNPEDIVADTTVDVEDLEPADRYTELEHLIDIDIDEFLAELDILIDDTADEFDLFTFDIDEDISYDDEYNMPDIGEVLGSLDINDFIGDLSNESKIIEFQDIDETIPDLEDDVYGLL